jgi:hypothetical protein
MLKKTITYEDYDGQTRTEDFYFNLTEAELQRYYFEHSNEGMMEYLKSILLTKNTKGMMDFIAEIITISFGVKSEDGKRFVCLRRGITANVVDRARTDGKNAVKILCGFHDFLGGGHICVTHIGVNLEFVFKSRERFQNAFGNAHRVFVGNDVDLLGEFCVCQNFTDLVNESAVSFVYFQIKGVGSAAGAILQALNNGLQIHDQ